MSASRGDSEVTRTDSATYGVIGGGVLGPSLAVSLQYSRPMSSVESELPGGNLLVVPRTAFLMLRLVPVGEWLSSVRSGAIGAPRAR